MSFCETRRHSTKKGHCTFLPHSPESSHCSLHRPVSNESEVLQECIPVVRVEGAGGLGLNTGHNQPRWTLLGRVGWSDSIVWSAR